MELSPKNAVSCVFRQDVRREGTHVTAECNLVRLLAGVSGTFRVPESTCRLCDGGSIEHAIQVNPVLPSLVFQACSERLEGDAKIESHERRRLSEYVASAEEKLLMDSLGGAKRHGTWACDVLIVVPDEACEETGTLIRSIESVLNQQSTRTFVHVVGGSRARHAVEAIGNPIQLIWHEWITGRTVGWQLHRVIKCLRSEFVAWHDPDAVATPTRLRDSIAGLWFSGSEFWMTPVDRGAQKSTWQTHWGAELSSRQRQEAIGSLVFRRSSLVDLGGFAECEDAIANLVTRAIAGGRQLQLGKQASVEYPYEAHSLGTHVAFVGDHQELAEPIGFELLRTDCDLVLPFFNKLSYVEESIAGALAQENANITIHLVDDASTEDTSDLVRRWRGTKGVRFYRNKTNIGQFMSLNNVAPFCESGLIGVQDADDISLPHRITTAGTFLELCDAEFFGGAVELFGDDHSIRPVFDRSDSLELVERADIRKSFYPPAMNIPYFLENPTAVFRRDMFLRQGGYADFGTREMNRSSLDSEFLLRCFFGGVRFAITQTIVTRYRVHQDSATQDRVTGWGTEARAMASRIVHQHTQMFRQGRFDPRVYGSLGRYGAETERLF